MSRLSRDESLSIAIVGITVGVLAWYRTDLVGIQRWIGAAIGLAVSLAVATATIVF